MKRDPLIGKKLANFRVDKPIGSGGMATVYYGIDTQLERPVAIKVINTIYQEDPEFARRFIEEAKIMARWRHENIISVYYAGNEDDIYYFVMEYIDGATLEDLLTDYINRGELMPHQDVIRVGRAVANALDYAHEQGVVHRDIKPSNIMISRDDRVVLTDFGLALDMGQGSMGQVFGTPHYISPEQARKSADATPQSDVYSLGVVFYEALTGAIPFDDPSATTIAVQHITQEPPKPTMLNPALNDTVEGVLLAALSKEADDRYPTARDFIEALSTALDTLQQSKTNTPPIMPPAAITGASNVPKISRLSISDMLTAEINDEIATQKSTTNNAIHQEATREAPAPKLTQPSSQNRTSEVPQIPASATNPDEEDGFPATLSKYFFFGGTIVVLVVIALIIYSMNTSPDLPRSIDGSATPQGANSSSVNVTTVATDAPTDSLPTATITPDTVATDTAIQATADAQSAADTIASATAIAVTNSAIQLTNDAQLVINTQIANDAQATTNAQQEATLTQSAVIVNQQPTQVFPNGRLIEMTYNSAGFYLRNSSSSPIRDNRLAFQAINADGSPVSTLFDGGEWARFYGNIDSDGRCVAIELLDQASWVRPANCVQATGSNSQFNSLLTFTDTDDRIFWQAVSNNNATQFIVYWDDAEIARCTITDGFCQVRVGN